MQKHCSRETRTNALLLLGSIEASGALNGYSHPTFLLSADDKRNYTVSTRTNYFHLPINVSENSRCAIFLPFSRSTRHVSSLSHERTVISNAASRT